MKIVRYTKCNKEPWDNFVAHSKNGTFLLYRDFMDYHADRFTDHSLLFYKENQLLGILAANERQNTFFSHQGLTYGGLITGTETKASDVLEIFEHLIKYLSDLGFQELCYKAIPYIYHKQPSDEDLYALFIQKAQLKSRSISSAIFLPKERINYSNSRTNGLKKAKKARLHIAETSDFESFWEILSKNLSTKYKTAPTHSLEEILLLKSRFPKNILLYGVFNPNNELVGGEVVFETDCVTHAQYTAATNDGISSGAIDLVIDHIINKASASKKYFDYGISTEDNGLYLNRGLIEQKEGFGARAIVYDIYSIKLK